MNDIEDNQESMSAPASPIPAVVETWRLSIGTTVFSIDVRADGSWQPFTVAPVRFGGWTMRALSAAPPAHDVEAAVRAWASQYGPEPCIRRVSPRRPRDSDNTIPETRK